MTRAGIMPGKQSRRMRSALALMYLRLVDGLRGILAPGFAWVTKAAFPVGPPRGWGGGRCQGRVM
jgi:hypothetical protein